MNKITSLPGIGWSPEAALEQLKQHDDNIDQIFVLYTLKDDPEKYLNSVAANLKNSELLWFLEKYKASLLAKGD